MLHVRRSCVVDIEEGIIIIRIYVFGAINFHSMESG